MYTYIYIYMYVCMLGLAPQPLAVLPPAPQRVTPHIDVRR